MKNRHIDRVGFALVLFLIVLALFPEARALAAPDAQAGDVNPRTITYKPDEILMGKDGIIYLLDIAHSSIYRWSIAQRDYLETINFSTPPIHMAYSGDTNILYVSHQNVVTQIKLDQSLVEEPFATLDWIVRGLANANGFVFVNDRDEGANSLYYIYDPQGSLTFSYTNWQCWICYYSSEFIWSKPTQKMYFISDWVTPNHLWWIHIDSTGVIQQNNYTPWNIEDFKHPIRVTTDGSLVMVGSGRIYDADTLTYTNKSIPGPLTDAFFTASNELFAMRPSGLNTQVEKWDAAYQQVTTVNLRGVPVRIFPSGSGLVAITFLLQSPSFWILDDNLAIDYVFQPVYPAYLPVISFPYPVYLPPGLHPVNQCQSNELIINSTDAGVLTECVTSVEIRLDGYLKFNYTWMLNYKPDIPPVHKNNDYYNPNMYVMDNLGNHYNHVAVGGAASGYYGMPDGVPIEGWFLFVPAKQNATIFSFRDDDQGFSFDNINLGP